MPLLPQAQDFLNRSQVNGNFQVNAQTYYPDEHLGITDSTLRGNTFRMNAYGDIRYRLGNFSAGLRYEAYLPPLAGFDYQYEGMGVPYWFAEYQGEKFQVTAGHFYEQFGSGMIFRSYQEWDLGYDNSINGMRIKLNPVKGVYIKALAGVHRYYWEKYTSGDRGIVKAFDMEVILNDLFGGMQDSKTQWILGGSFVSKFEKEQRFITKEEDSVTIKYELRLPDNVAAAGGRLTMNSGGFSANAEYVYKYNNPSAFNNYIYKAGEGALLNLSYSRKGLGIFLAAKRIDNMSYKSKMTELGNVLDINFIPPLTTPHAYALAAVYPYGTQLNGENTVQGQIIYTLPRKSKLGGRYGTTLEANYSIVHGLDLEPVDPGSGIGEPGTAGYQSKWFSTGPLYFQDLNLKFDRRISRDWKLIVEYLNLTYNIEVIEGHPGEPLVHANIGIIDLTYKLTTRQSLRMELQGLFTEQDKGDWVMVQVEYNVAPKWFFTLLDQYNYGHPDPEMRLHYYTANIAYADGPHRISMGYGRQREGILCVGGVCRQVPAANGFTLTVSSSF